MKWIEKNLEHQLATAPGDDDAGLLTRAAEMMRRNRDQQAATKANLGAMVTHAQEELKIVERLLQDSEQARTSIEHELEKAKAKLQETEALFEARHKLLEQERSALENCAKAAEARAIIAEENLARLRTGLGSLFDQYEKSDPTTSDLEEVGSPNTAPELSQTIIAQPEAVSSPLLSPRSRD
jgi:hypothetical protein